MSFADKLGKSYGVVRDQAKIKKIDIELGEVKFTLKVRIPLKHEMESITEKIANPDPEKVELIYSDLTKTMKQSLEDGGEEFLKLLNSEKETIKVTDDDIIINGTSTRQVSNMTAIWQTQVEQYFHLLESETGDPIDETYEQISSEFPEQIIKEIVTAIDGAIRPDYKTAKKN
jgi:hypothetical protein